MDVLEAPQITPEIVAEHGLGCRVLRRGISRGLDGVSGSERYLLDRHGLSRAAIVKAALGSRELIIG